MKKSDLGELKVKNLEMKGKRIELVRLDPNLTANRELACQIILVNEAKKVLFLKCKFWLNDQL